MYSSDASGGRAGRGTNAWPGGAAPRPDAAPKRRTSQLTRSSRVAMLAWLVLVLAPLATVGGPALLHAVLYLAPALVFLVPLCLNRDPAGELLVRLAQSGRTKRANRARKPQARAGIRSAVVWLPGGGLLIGMARAGRAPPVKPLPAVLALH